MRDLGAGVSRLEDAVAAARRFVPADVLDPIAGLASSVRRRHGFLGETVVVALAGGTGSGKSSLLNALAGSPVSEVGAVRPTTADPVAWVPANPEPGLVRMLDALGLERRVGHDTGRPLALIDLPDYDSVEFEHRATVERLVPQVDAVVWVLDPQKYSDRALHRDYLVPLAPYQGQFLFVLNQVDRLSPAGLEAVLADLDSRLATEGYSNAAVVTTAARPADGGPARLGELDRLLTDRFEEKQVAAEKLSVDLAEAHRALVAATGEAGDGAALAQRWNAQAADIADELADVVAGPDARDRIESLGERLAVSKAAGPLGRLGALLRRSRLGRAFGAGPDEARPGVWWEQPGMERVLAATSRTVTDLSLQLGGPAGRDLRAELAPDRLDSELRAAVEGARDAVGELTAPPPRRWWGAVGVIQLALFAALVTGLVWLWVDGVDRGKVPWNLILVGGAVVAGAVFTWLVKASGRRAGRTSARAYRAELEASLMEQIDSRIGRRLGEVLEDRRRFTEALDGLETALTR